LRAAADALATYDWVVFTSANAVDRFVPLLRDARAFGAARVAAIGPGTADRLGAANVAADLVPERFVAEGLLDAFPAGPGRVLLPRAAVARDVLPDGLRDRGWDVDVVEAYRTERVAPTAAALEAAGRADAITFTSSSTVTNFLAVAGADAVPPVVACIGHVTADTARAAGLQVTVEADVHTLEGLVEALLRWFAA
jgi:uroporphyrinogen-III synthase